MFNKIFVVVDGWVGCIVEVEVYVGVFDLVVYIYCGKILCNVMMFGLFGYFYVYFMYGMYWCCNCVCGLDGVGMGVLIWVLELLYGFE